MSGLNWNRRRKIHTPWFERPKQSADDDFMELLAVKPGRAEPHVSARAAIQEADSRIEKAKAALAGATYAIVHTDGGCEPNPGAGGWACIVDAAPGERLELCGGDRSTTNNRMEMTAAIVALTVLPTSCAATIVSDSQYLVKGMTSWLAGWKKCGFQKKNAPIPNADLWRSLDALSAGRTVKWQWVRGHNGHGLNERADELATEGRLLGLRSAP